MRFNRSNFINLGIVARCKQSMISCKILSIVFAGLLLLSCNDTTQVKVQEVKLADLKEDSTDSPPIPPAPTGLKVSAYLIYKDSTTSTFDVLNDKTIALWNTIIGAGDAEQPSDRTKIKLTGKLDSLRLIIHNGKSKIEDQRLPNFSGDYEFILNNTGCQEISVIVTKIDKVVFKGTIPFECGE